MSPDEVAEKLLADVPWLATPDGAFDQCIAASRTLAKDMVAAGHRASVVRVQGWRAGVDTMTVKGLLPDLWTSFGAENWSHWLVRVEGAAGEVFYDLTARQFDPRLDCPLVMTGKRLYELWDCLDFQPDASTACVVP